MKTLHTSFLFSFLLVCSITAFAQNQQTLNAKQFSEKLKQNPNAVLLDVRTPVEFKENHLAGARNINWFGKDFDKQISEINKKQPLFVYCLSGGRSEEAATKLRKEGFQNVYELDGGIAAWKDAKMPVTNGKQKTLKKK
jgi:rhodanese-related sulfurtransferase